MFKSLAIYHVSSTSVFKWLINTYTTKHMQQLHKLFDSFNLLLQHVVSPDHCIVLSESKISDCLWKRREHENNARGIRWKEYELRDEDKGEKYKLSFMCTPSEHINRLINLVTKVTGVSQFYQTDEKRRKFSRRFQPPSNSNGQTIAKKPETLPIK